MAHTRHSGFTYIELLIVVGLIGIILSFGLAMGMGSTGRSSVTQERDLFVSLLLTGARAQAVANIDEKAHGIHIDNDNNRYILFDGTSYNPSASTNRATPFTNESIDITGAENIVFEQLSGNVKDLDDDDTITLIIKGGGAEGTITINKVGQINW